MITKEYLETKISELQGNIAQAVNAANALNIEVHVYKKLLEELSKEETISE